MWKPSPAPPVEAYWSQALAQHPGENVASTVDKGCQHGQSKRPFSRHCSHTGKTGCRKALVTQRCSHTPCTQSVLDRGRAPLPLDPPQDLDPQSRRWGQHKGTSTHASTGRGLTRISQFHLRWGVTTSREPEFTAGQRKDQGSIYSRANTNRSKSGPGS